MAETSDNNDLELGVAGMEISLTEPTADRQEEEEEEDVPMLYLDRVLALHGAVDMEGAASDDDGGLYDDGADESVDQFVLVGDEGEEYVGSESGSDDDDDDDDGSNADVALYYDSDESTVLAEVNPPPDDFGLYASCVLSILSKADKAELRWRLSQLDSFSDWKIEVQVCVENADADADADAATRSWLLRCYIQRVKR